MNAARRKRLADVIDELTSIRDEEQEAYDATPESIQQGERGQISEEAIRAMDSAISEIEGIQ